MSSRGGLVIDGDNGDQHVIEHNILAHTNFDAAIIQRTGSGHEANYNCFYDNSASVSGSEITQTGNVTADPNFASRSGRDYRLSPNSGCLAVVQYDTAAKINEVW